MWQAAVLCARCGERNDCGRIISEPCEFAIVCSFCEDSLVVTVTSGDLAFQRDADAYESHIPFHISGFPASGRSDLLRYS